MFRRNRTSRTQKESCLEIQAVCQFVSQSQFEAQFNWLHDPVTNRPGPFNTSPTVTLLNSRELSSTQATKRDNWVFLQWNKEIKDGEQWRTEICLISQIMVRNMKRCPHDWHCEGKQVTIRLQFNTDPPFNLKGILKPTYLATKVKIFAPKGWWITKQIP